jgi:pro-sigmaK processing inhibitor BofA
MSLWLQILVYAVGIGLVIAVITALFRTKKPIRALVGSGAQGVCALAAVNILGTFTGVSLGLNVFTGLCCAVLGIPGVISLLVLKIIMNY